MRYRKPRAANKPDRRSESTELRRVSRLLSKREFSAALTSLDSLSRAARKPEVKAKIAALAAQSEFLQGKFQAAAATFKKAEHLAPESGQVWLGPAIGRVRARLKAVELENATAAGKETLAKAVKQWNRFEKLAAKAAKALNQSGTFTVDERPPRPSVVAFRIGQQFWAEGEPDAAVTFYAESLRLEPGGACRARIALARIALVSNEPKKAFDLAKEALTIGHFHAKTLSAWPILIAASQKLEGIDLPGIAKGLDQAVPGVRGRAKLSIASCLRNFGDPAWISFATVTRKEDPEHILETEFEKMRLASAAHEETGSPRIAKLAGDLLDTPNLGPREWLAAAKTLVKAKLSEDADPGIGTLIREGLRRYGNELKAIFRLGISLACIQAKRGDLALPLLRDNVANAQGEDWSRSAWTLARLHRTRSDFPATIELFNRIAETASVLPRFRVYARMEWMRTAVESGDPDTLAGAKSAVLEAANQTADFELLLDLSRQMALAPGELAEAAGAVFARGEQLAVQAFESEESPAKALEIYYKLARRRSDLGHFIAILRDWHQLPPGKKSWLWAPQSAFWETVALVAAAFRAQSRHSEAVELADLYLQDPATCPDGLAIIGIPHALDLLNRGDKPNAFELLKWISSEAPTHPLCAYAYYWFALQAQAASDTQNLDLRTGQLRLALGSTIALGWQKDLAARADLLASRLSAEAAASSSAFDKTFLESQKEVIRQDLQRL